MSERARILVVDDTEASRYSVARTLKAAGYQVLEGATGQEALELAREHQPQLLVLDVKLPDILGFEVVERLKADERTRSIAVLHVSASFTGADAQAQGLERGADGYLVHPIDPHVLTATVRALLRMREAEQREREARERAEASEKRYRFLADVVPQMVWSSDPAGNVDYYNRRWLEFAGLPPEGVAEVDWTASAHPDDRPRLAEAWKRALRSSQPLEIEIRRWSPPADSFRWLLIRAQPMKGPDGQIVRWFGTCTDIETQRQALREREKLLAEAREAAAERGSLVAQLEEEARRRNDFLATLSHELRNPLAPVRNSLYILERAVPGGEQAKRAREVIDRQVQHLTRLVDDLLDVTRIARGKIRLQRESLELNGLVRRSVEDHRELFRRAGLELAVRTWERPLAVDGDPTRLAQVVSNLLQNAAKFTPSGGRVEVAVQLDGPTSAVVTVRDNGAGIARETLGRLFEPFVQAESSLDRSRGGLGLGLALAKGIVELHGGSIVAESAGLGTGSEFVVRLPLEERVSVKLALVGSARSQSRLRRVLIIEDNVDAADSLKEVLELAGHQVEVARDGYEGLTRAEALEPDVIFCDIGLPGIDGYEVSRRLRASARTAEAFAVALSGYALPEDVEKSRAAGFDRHLAKPPRFEDLERLIAEAPAKARAG